MDMFLHACLTDHTVCTVGSEYSEENELEYAKQGLLHYLHSAYTDHLLKPPLDSDKECLSYFCCFLAVLRISG